MSPWVVESENRSGDDLPPEAYESSDTMKCLPLPKVKVIMITGAAGFMYGTIYNLWLS